MSNEYIKAQELALYGYKLDKIDAVKAVTDKKELEANQINKLVEAKIDAYLAEQITKKVVKKEDKKGYKENPKKEDKKSK